VVAVQLSAGNVAVQSVVAPVVNTTLPVALEGSAAEYVTDCPKLCDVGAVDAVYALTVMV
jgi:hypothetical protein